VARSSRGKAASGGSSSRRKRAGTAARSARPRSSAATARPARGARARSAGTLEFWSRDWAQAAKKAWNAGPSPEARAKKIARFWEWIEKAKQYVDCQLVLAVEGLPGNGARDCLLLDLEQGRCVRARLATRHDAEATATYILTGSYRDWREIMGGFDLGKAVMYRKLMLEKGEVLVFFKSIYYWTESLACLQRIPTRFSTADTTAN
jgi:putative sterol carrier protein